MRELIEQEMQRVTGGSASNGPGSVPAIGPLIVGGDPARVVAAAHLATIQSELDALNVNEQIWSSLSDS
jgi:hypothetical protein